MCDILHLALVLGVLLHTQISITDSHYSGLMHKDYWKGGNSEVS